MYCDRIGDRMNEQEVTEHWRMAFQRTSLAKYHFWKGFTYGAIFTFIGVNVVVVVGALMGWF